MRKRLILIPLIILALTGCSGYQMGNLMPPAATMASQPQMQETIELKTRSRSLAQSASHVFNQNGWKTVAQPGPSITIKLSAYSDQYDHPWFLLMYFGSLGVLPFKTENYYHLSARIYVDDVEQEHISYASNVTEYTNCYGPIGLLIPGTTHRDVGLDTYVPSELRQQAYRNMLQHLADDLRARYFTSNYQPARI